MPIDVIVADIGNVTFSQAEKYLGYVSALRRDRIAKKRCDEDKLLSLAAGLLLSRELSRRSGIPTDKLRYRHGSFGKPYLIGSELQFSLSHTKGAVGAAFSDSGEVGADIERLSRRVSRRIYDRVLSDNEKQRVHSSEDLIRLWVQKEAFLKRLGTGIAADLRGADTDLICSTVEYDCGEYAVGVSGNGAQTAQISRITVSELLDSLGGLK